MKLARTDDSQAAGVDRSSELAPMKKDHTECVHYEACRRLATYPGREWRGCREGCLSLLVREGGTAE